MIVKKIKFSKLLLITCIVILSTQTVNAGWQDYVEENKSFTVKILPNSLEDRKETLKNIFSQREVTAFDLSASNATDEDLKSVAVGLATRTKTPNHLPLKLLDISSKNITKNGVELLLESLENGISIKEKDTVTITDDIKNMIIKVPFNVSNKLHARWCEKAPTVFSNGLTILQ